MNLRLVTTQIFAPAVLANRTTKAAAFGSFPALAGTGSSVHYDPYCNSVHNFP